MYFVWVPIAVVALLLLAWAVLSGLPFNREPRRPQQQQVEVVREQEVSTATVARIEDSTAPSPAPIPPSAAPRPAPKPELKPQPKPVPQPAPPQRPAPQPAPQSAPQPAPQPERKPPPEPASQPAGEVSAAQAQQALRSYIVSRRDYGVAGDCLAITSRGYRNAGYTFDVSDRCSARSLGRWRIDAKDPSAVFRQRSDGRFLAP